MKVPHGGITKKGEWYYAETIIIECDGNWTDDGVRTSSGECRKRASR